MNNASITIAVLPDDIPELDEKFIIELVNVTGQNERLRPGAVCILLFLVFCLKVSHFIAIIY